MTFKILLVGAHDHTIERIIAEDLQYLLFQVPGRVSERQKATANSILTVDYEKPENEQTLITLAQALHAASPFDAVLTFVEYGQELAAKIADVLSLPTNTSLAAMEYTRDKLQMRDLLSQHGINNIPYATVSNKAELTDFFNDNGHKVIIKPSRGGGGEGIHIITALEQIDQAMPYTDSFNRGDILAEKFIEGEEYSVESISGSGHEIVAITEKEIGGAPYFVEKGHVQPANVDADIAAKIQQTVISMLDVIGHGVGPAHTEVKVCQGQVYIIETQLRIGGDQIWEMALGTTGVDLVSETICAIAGLDRPPRKPKYTAMAIQFFSFAHSEVSAIVAPAELDDEPNLVRLQLNRQKLPWTGPARKSLDRLGYVLVNAQTADLAQQQAKQLVGKLEFK